MELPSGRAGPTSRRREMLRISTGCLYPQAIRETIPRPLINTTTPATPRHVPATTLSSAHRHAPYTPKPHPTIGKPKPAHSEPGTAPQSVAPGRCRFYKNRPDPHTPPQPPQAQVTSFDTADTTAHKNPKQPVSPPPDDKSHLPTAEPPVPKPPLSIQAIPSFCSISLSHHKHTVQKAYTFPILYRTDI